MSISGEERALVLELAALGLNVDAPADLYNNKLDYRKAVPLLIEWLPRLSEPGVKEEVVRALSTKWAKPSAAEALLREFQLDTTDPSGVGLRWAIGNALSVVATDAAFDSVLGLATCEEYGKAREMLVVALGNMKDTPEAEAVLVGLLDDDVVVGHALIGLRRLGGGSAARGKIEQLTRHSTKWVRAEAVKLLKRVDKSS